MPLAYNDKGDALYLDDASKTWKPAPVATNPKGEKLIFDGKTWTSPPAVPSRAAPAAKAGAPTFPGAPAPSSRKPGEGISMPGSVFDKPTLAERVGRIGRAVGPPVVGMSTAMAGTELGAAVGSTIAPGPGTVVGGLVGAAAGGAAAPFVERQAAQRPGEPYQPPTSREVITSAVTNAAFQGFGEMLAYGAGKYAAAKDEIEALPRAQQTVTNVKKMAGAVEEATGKEAEAAAKVTAQDLRNRDFWKAYGLKDEQIDEVLKQPDLQQELARSIESANQTKRAFQTVVDNTRQDFNGRYDSVLGNVKATTESASIGQQFDALAKGGGQHELTPSFQSFLERKGESLGSQIDLAKVNPDSPEDMAAVQRILRNNEGWTKKNFVDATAKEQIGAAKRSLQAHPTQQQAFSIQDVRDLRTELRENLPRGATNLDKQAAKGLNDSLTKLEVDLLKKGGATPEQIGGLRTLDAEYGRFQETLSTLDPRSEKFSQEVADALFDPMVSSHGNALNFINLAQKADAAQLTTLGATGEVMPQLRAAFVEKALNMARTPGEPMEELKYLRQLQDKFGGDQQMRAVMGAMFGKNSPLADPAMFTRIVEGGAQPAKIAFRASQQAGRNIFRSPYMQAMILYGGLAALTGTKGGMFAALTGQKGAPAFAMAVSSILIGGRTIGWVASSGNSPLQRAMVAYMTNPNVANTIEYTSRLAGSFATGFGPAQPTPAP